VTMERPRQVEGVMDNPASAPDLTCLAFARPRSFGSLSNVAFVSYVACHLINALRYPEVLTPTVATERFCDHEVIVKALVCMYVTARTQGRSLFGMLLGSLLVGVFNAASGHHVSLCQCILMMQHLSCHVRGLHIGARVLGRIKWSC
jgi:branched-subunit amino acid transport protein